MTRKLLTINQTSLIAAILLMSSGATGAAELQVTVTGAPEGVPLVFQVYDSASAFGDFRDPATEHVVQSTGDGEYRVPGVPDGDVALLVYVDQNENGIIDKSFIGIPREPLGLSNNYRPKGPPTFDRASFVVLEDSVTPMDIEIYKVLGERGRLGVGVGVIGRGNPYVDPRDNVFQAIPAITYTGERLQWLGPTFRYGILGSGNLRLAIAADYRIGAYEEDTADSLAGLGDREDTLMAGLGLQWVIGAGVELAANYQHDVLDQIGGGQATANLSRSFQAGVFRLTPFASVNWLSSDLSNHDFGVPPAAALPGRPAYSVGSTTNVEVGLNSFIEITEDWRVLLNLSYEQFDDAISASPIVADDGVVKGFAAITYVF